MNASVTLSWQCGHSIKAGSFCPETREVNCRVIRAGVFPSFWMWSVRNAGGGETKKT